MLFLLLLLVFDFVHNNSVFYNKMLKYFYIGLDLCKHLSFKTVNFEILSGGCAQIHARHNVWHIWTQKYNVNKKLKIIDIKIILPNILIKRN